jgi:hypothetical protein
MKETDLQRIGHFHGQLLTAHDLQDDVDNESRLRGLHMRAVHNSWGVAIGYTVTLPAANVVSIGPGVAYNCYGQEIISARAIGVGLPPAPSQSQADAWLFDLVIRYRMREDSRPGRDCLAPGLSPRAEQPVWRWRFAGDAASDAVVTPARPEPLRLGEEIPLARFVVSASGIVSGPDFSERCHAQGLVRPHIAGGQHIGELVYVEEQFAFSLKVDTAAAGFSRTPYYFARLTLSGILDTITDPQIVVLLRRLIGPFITIRDPRRKSFHLDVRFALSGTNVRGASFAGDVFPSPFSAEVNWVGIEANTGCPPPPLPFFFFPFLTPQLTGLSTVGGGVFTSGGFNL